MTKKELLADGIMMLTALIWGSGFVVMKNTLDSLPPAAIIALRYTLATAIVSVLFRKRLAGLDRGDAARGAVVGLLLGLAYIVQTIGLSHTTAGKNAFLTTVYVLLVPFGCRALFKQKLAKSNFIAAGMMMLGIGLLSLDGESGGLNIGDVLTLCSGALFAAHIIAIDRCQKKTDMYALIVLQFAVAAVVGFVYHLLFERGMPLVLTGGSIGGLLYLSVFSTTIAMSLQNIGQSMAPASHASIILSLEAVVGAAFSCLLLGGRLSPNMALGVVVIFAALMVSELAKGKKEA